MNVASHTIPPLPAKVRYVVLVLSVVTLVSAVIMAFATVVTAPTPVWVMFGFEVAIAIAGCLGLAGWRGRFDEGQGLWLACISGTLLVGGFLSYLATRGGFVLTRGGASWSPVWWCAGRMVLAAGFGVLAVYAVLRRSREGRAYFVRAMLLGAACAIVAGPFALARGVPSFMNTIPNLILGAVLFIIALVWVILACAAGHCLIRAFECARGAPSANHASG
ncbi:MAG: hypothetical protein HBSAPP03_03690 [Phycisphaerae bacterium]|nr:MAG: hypothetical protein HBSAPP03_03690 [Phycisphaerae bacterium]